MGQDENGLVQQVSRTVVRELTVGENRDLTTMRLDDLENEIFVGRIASPGAWPRHCCRNRPAARASSRPFARVLRGSWTSQQSDPSGLRNGSAASDSTNVRRVARSSTGGRCRSRRRACRPTPRRTVGRGAWRRSLSMAGACRCVTSVGGRRRSRENGGTGGGLRLLERNHPPAGDLETPRGQPKRLLQIPFLRLANPVLHPSGDANYLWLFE
jgi:hypothetical protein